MGEFEILFGIGIIDNRNNGSKLYEAIYCLKENSDIWAFLMQLSVEETVKLLYNRLIQRENLSENAENLISTGDLTFKLNVGDNLVPFTGGAARRSLADLVEYFKIFFPDEKVMIIASVLVVE